MIQEILITDQQSLKSSRERDCDTNASSNGDQPDSPSRLSRRLCRNTDLECGCPDRPFCTEAHSLPELLKEQSLQLEFCPNFHSELTCSLGANCGLNHNQRPLSDIIHSLWRGNRLRLLTSYPELLTIQGASKSCSLLF